MNVSAEPWGPGYRAAVSLTYDDGIPNHLDIAIPMLEEYGFRGSFYLITSTDSDLMRGRTADWQAAFRRGHEIGNHSAHHPGWGLKDAKPTDLRLETFGPDDILREIGDAATWLDQNIGPDPGRTYAYPYAHNFIGPDKTVAPYEAAVRRFCAGSRLGGTSVPNPPGTDPFALRSFGFGAHPPAEVLIGYCEQALRSGGWTILTFHGVGGPWIETPAETHRLLLDYLKSEPIRVAPIRNILADTRR